MPKFHNEKELEKLLIKNNVSLTDAVKRGAFYREFFDWELLSRKYKDGYSIQDICKETNLSYDTVRANLIRNGCEMRKFTQRGKSSFKIYKNHFETLDNIGAYLLGWLYTDGCLTDSGVIMFAQKREDEKHFRYVMSLFTNKKPKINKKGYVELNLNDISFVDYLRSEYNLLPRKSFKNFKIPFEKFSDEQLPYLLLGMFEGDGSVSKHCLSSQFLIPEVNIESLLNRLKFIDINNKYSEIKISNYGLIRVDLSGNNYFNFFDYIYCNTLEVTRLKRKYETLLLQLERSINGVTSPYSEVASKLRDSLKLKKIKSL